MSGTGIAVLWPGGFARNSLLNLRTEIVLKDANDVAFWFSLGSRLVTHWQQKMGERRFAVPHQTEAKPKALFPEWPEYGKYMDPGEVGPRDFQAAQSRGWPLFSLARFEFEFRLCRYGENK
jgi:hypothetical protein